MDNQSDDQNNTQRALLQEPTPKLLASPFPASSIQKNMETQNDSFMANQSHQDAKSGVANSAEDYMEPPKPMSPAKIQDEKENEKKEQDFQKPTAADPPRPKEGPVRECMKEAEGKIDAFILARREKLKDFLYNESQRDRAKEALLEENSDVPPRQKLENSQANAPEGGCFHREPVQPDRASRQPAADASRRTEPTKMFDDPEISDVVDYDFGNLPVEAQVIASEQISNSQITPIDFAEYAQVMPIENGSILLVQRLYLNVFNEKDQNTPQGAAEEVRYKQRESYDQEKLATYKRDLQNFVHKKLVSQTTGQAIKTNYKLEFEEKNNEIKLSQEPQANKESKLNGQKQVALVSLWEYKTKNKTFQCTKQFYVKDPVFMNPHKDVEKGDKDAEMAAELILPELFFKSKSDPQKVCFFSFTTETGSLKLHKVNLDEAKSSDQELLPCEELSILQSELKSKLVTLLGITKKDGNLVQWPHLFGTKLVIPIDSKQSNGKVDLYVYDYEFVDSYKLIENTNFFINFFQNEVAHLRIVDNGFQLCFFDVELEAQANSKIHVTFEDKDTMENVQKLNRKRLAPMIFTNQWSKSLQNGRFWIIYNSIEEDDQLHNYYEFQFSRDSPKEIVSHVQKLLFVSQSSKGDLKWIKFLDYHHDIEKQTFHQLKSNVVVDMSEGAVSKQAYALHQTLQTEHETNSEYYLPYEIKAIPVFVDEDEKDVQHAAFLYKDISGKINFSFSNSKAYSSPNNEQPREYFSLPNIEYQQNHLVDYPLLAYLGPQPLRNRLNIVNQVKSSSQISIDLNKFEFVCFVNVVQRISRREEDKLGISHIDFLVRDRDLDPHKDKFHILSYQKQPWVIENQSQQLQCIQQDIKIDRDEKRNTVFLTVFFFLDQKLVLFQTLDQEHKIQYIDLQTQSVRQSESSQAIRSKSSDSEKQKIEMDQEKENSQMIDIVKKMNEPEETDFKLMPIKMVEDGVISAFFVCKSEGNHEKFTYHINRFDAKKKTTETVYKRDFSSIIGFQKLYQSPKKFHTNEEFAPKLLIFYDDFHHDLIATDHIFGDPKQYKYRLIESTKVKSKYTKKLIDNLKCQSFSPIILEQDSIIAQKFMFSSSYGADTNLTILDSQANLILNHDNFFAYLMIPDDFRTQSISAIQNIGKNLVQINNEQGQGFFVSIQKPSRRQVDLMTYRKMQLYIHDIDICDNRVFLIVNDQDKNSKQTDCIEINRKTQIFTDYHCKIHHVMTTRLVDDAQNRSQKGFVKQHQDFVRLETWQKQIKLIECSDEIKCLEPCTYTMTKLEKIIEKEVKTLVKKDSLINQKKLFYDGLFNIVYSVKPPERRDGKTTQKISLQKVDCQNWLESKYPINEIYIIEGDIFERTDDLDEEKFRIKILYTENYVVIRVDLKVYYFIKPPPPQDNKPVECRLYQIPLHDFQNELKKNAREALAVDIVRRSNLKFFQNDNESTDLLQLSIQDFTIVWDLDSNSELSYIKSYKEFFDPEKFVSTGFDLVVTDRKRVKSGQFHVKLQKMKQDQFKSAFVIPYSRTDVGSYFTPFTQTGLAEILHYKTSKSFNENVLKLSRGSVLSQVYGHTIFTNLFQNWVKIQIEKEKEDTALNYYSIPRLCLKLLESKKIDRFNEDTDQDDKQANEQDILTFSRQLCSLVQMPAPNELDFKSLIKKADLDDNTFGSKDFRRNIIQIMLALTFYNKSQCSILVTPVQQLLQICTNQSDVQLNAACSTVDEFQQLYIQFNQLKVSDMFLDKWRAQADHFIIEVPWRRRDEKLVFGANTSFMGRKKVEREIEKQQKILKKQTWLYLFMEMNRQNFKKVVKRIKLDSLNKLLDLDKPLDVNSPFWKCYNQLTCMKKNEADQIKDERIVTQVIVRKYKIEWLNDEKNGQSQMSHLYAILSKTPFIEMFDDQFLKDILNIDNITYKLFVQAMVPYLWYVIWLLYYYTFLLGKPKALRDDAYNQSFIVSWCCIFLALFWLAMLEFTQLLRYGLRSYLTDVWNIVTTVRAVLVISIFTFEILDYRGIELAIFPSVSTFLLLIQLYYWSQMFIPAAMYSYIIFESVKATWVFMVMCLLVIVSFGFSIFVLDQTQLQMFADENPPIWEEQLDKYEKLAVEKTGYETIDSIYTQYLLMLGEFEILESDGVQLFTFQSKLLIWTYFFLATLFTNVIFFNTLVAVIGEAYNDLWRHKDRFALLQRTKIHADYITLLNPKVPAGKVLYYVQPVNEVDDEEKQANAVAQINEHVNELDRKLEASFDNSEARFDKLQARFDNSEARFDKFEARFDNLVRKIDEIVKK